MLKHLALFAVLLVAIAHCSSVEDNLKRVLANYDKSKATGGNQSATVQISLYIMFLDLDDVTKEMTATMFFRQSWTDSRLSVLGDESVRLMDFDKIWLPDTYFRNDKNDQLAPGKSSDIIRSLRVSNSKVMYNVKLTGRFSCNLRSRRYPKDAPVCEMPIESFGNTVNTMKLEINDRDPIDFDRNVLDSAGFNLYNTEINDCTVALASGTFPCLNIKFYFDREVSLHFVTVVYLPSAVIVLVSTSSFWIQPDNPTPRLLVGLLTTLTVTLHAAAVRLYNISTVTVLTLLDLWLIGCVLIVFVAFVLQLAGVVIAGLKAKNRSEATKVEAAAAESSGSKPVTFITDLVGKIAIPVLFVLLIIIYAAV